MDILIEKNSNKEILYIDNEIAIEDKKLKPEQVVEAMGFSYDLHDFRNENK